MIRRLFPGDAARAAGLTPPGLARRRKLVLAWQILNAALESSAILVISLFCLALASPEALRNHAAHRWLARVLPDAASDRRALLALAVATALFILAKNLVACLAARAAVRHAERVAAALADRLLGHYAARDYPWHLAGHGARLLHGFAHRHHLAALLAATLQLHGYAVCAAAMTGGLFLLEPLLTAGVALLFAVTGGGAYLLLRRPMARHGRDAAREAGVEAATAHFAADAVRELLLHGRGPAVRERITAAMDRAIPAKTFLGHAALIPAWVLETAGFAAMAAVLAALLGSGRPLGAVVASLSLLLLTAWRLLPAVNRSWGLAVHIRGLAPFARICLDAVEEIARAPAAPPPRPDPGFVFARELSLDGVSFTYPGAAAPALDGVSLTVRRGEAVALLGRSGAGKTTLALLLAGLLPPESGNYAVDGAPLTPARRAALMRRGGVVPQNPVWLPGSVADNVALADWGGRADPARVAAALTAAGLAWLDPARPLGARGEGLSGGQAQRLALARALYAGPDILILDEATNALDGAGEAAIRRAVARLDPVPTRIVIAHRLESVAGCDTALWLDGGRVRERGPATEVAARYAAWLTSLPPG